MLKIFYDSAISGHHTEYISHLVSFIVNDETNSDEYIFIVPEAIQEKFPEIVELSQNSDKVIWEFIPTKKCEYLQNLPLLKRSFIELNLVEAYATKFNVKEVFLLYFNIFQLALVFKRPPFQIKGILFLQFYRMQKKTIGEKLKYFRKYYITKWYSWNPNIKKIFILNDKKTVDFLNSKFQGSKFKMLPDPIPLYQEECGFDVYDYYQISKNKKILLHPGAIDIRKGTFEIIEAIDLLKEKETAQYAIVIVGRAKQDIAAKIEKQIAELENKNFTIIFDNTFVSNERLKSIFLQSCAVLMPYKNPEASSGILGHATSSNKCVIAPESGLIGDIIRLNNLGVLINKCVASDIAKGIERLCEYKVNEFSQSLYVENHSVNFFSNKILK